MKSLKIFWKEPIIAEDDTEVTVHMANKYKVKVTNFTIVVGNGVNWDKWSIKFKNFSKAKIFKAIKNFRISLLLQGSILETSLIVLGLLEKT